MGASAKKKSSSNLTHTYTAPDWLLDVLSHQDIPTNLYPFYHFTLEPQHSALRGVFLRQCWPRITSFSRPSMVHFLNIMWLQLWTTCATSSKSQTKATLATCANSHCSRSCRTLHCHSHRHPTIKHIHSVGSQQLQSGAQDRTEDINNGCISLYSRPDIVHSDSDASAILLCTTARRCAGKQSNGPVMTGPGSWDKYQ